jgi:AcrR family transcriptional regulator
MESLQLIVLTKYAKSVDMFENGNMKHNSKRDAVFDAAAAVFAQYGFRRTSMNDIAVAAGISRPALYLLFQNKEDLFRQLANDRQSRAIDEAAAILARDAPIADRIREAILAYERIYYEPVAGSPHGAELTDLNQGAAFDDMVKGRDRLIGHMAQAIEASLETDKGDLPGSGLIASEFAQLLMLSISGAKKSATSIEDFRQKIRDIATIFMQSLT